MRAATAWQTDKRAPAELASPPDVTGLPSVMASDDVPDAGRAEAYGRVDGTLYLKLIPPGMACGVYGRCAPRWFESRWTPPTPALRGRSIKKKKKKNSDIDDLLMLADVDLDAGVQTRQRRKSLTRAPDRPAAAATTARRSRARAVVDADVPAYAGTTIEDLIGYCFNLTRVRAAMDPLVWQRVEEQFVPHVAQAKRDAQLFRANLTTRLVDPELQWSDLGMRVVFARTLDQRVLFRAVHYSPRGDEAEQQCFEAVFANQPQRVLVRFHSHAALLEALAPLTDYAYWLPWADTYAAATPTSDANNKLPSYVEMEPSLTAALVEKDAENSRLEDPEVLANRDAPKPNPFYVPHGQHGNRNGSGGVFNRLLNNRA